jgi:hypothetical protein
LTFDRLSSEDGVVIKEFANYRGLEFSIFPSGRIYISGSLHKYWNNGEHNFNDFNLKALRDVLKDFTSKFNINPQNTKITQLETGININPICPTNTFIENCFNHRKTPFKSISTKDEGHYIQALHQQYIIKIYDKKKHYLNKGYKINKEILRLEIKYLGSERIKKLGIRTLNDLMSVPFKRLIDDLLKELNAILFYDFTIKHKTTRLLNYSNPIYWNKLNESNYYKNKKLLNSYIENNSENIFKQTIEIVKRKSDELTFGGATINTLYIDLNPTPQKNKVCQITGLGISMQKSNSQLLSIEGLRYYKETNYKLFYSLLVKYVKKKFHSLEGDELLYKLAHQIRGKKYNSIKKNKQPIGQLSIKF